MGDFFWQGFTMSPLNYARQIKSAHKINKLKYKL